jgi:UDP-N-acetylmuramate: L-alanyl-gamma-D-glutamyl-meso-diaminopimelate ligase
MWITCTRVFQGKRNWHSGRVNEPLSESIYFLGIGGTAMAGAALLARQLGLKVSGSDQAVYEPTLSELRQNKISFHEGYRAENLSDEPDWLVLGNAISRGNVELEEALNRRMRIISLPEFMAAFVIRKRRVYAITGTHGKTTTTSLVAHILRSKGVDCGFMIGGICENFSAGAELGSHDYFVIEGDEYDTSVFDHRSKFLSYRPTHVLINNIEFDHADIFPDFEAVLAAFGRLVKIIPKNGLLVANADSSD